MSLVLAVCPPILKLERSTNRNRVWYHYAGGDEAEAHWEMREKGPDHWEKLTSLERTAAYGPKVLPVNDSAERIFTIAGYSSLEFRLKQGSDGCWRTLYEDTPIENIRIETSGTPPFIRLTRILVDGLPIELPPRRY